MASSWFDPNYTNPAMAGHAILPLGIALIIITTSIVAARLYTRCFMIKAMGWDDYLILPAWGLTVADTISAIGAAKYGYGKHLWDIPPDQYHELLFYSYMVTLFFTLGLIFVKLSILHVYLRFASRSSTFRTVLYGMIVVVSLWGVTMGGLNTFECYPVHRYWTNSVVDYSGCLSASTVTNIYYVHGITNTMSDIIIFFLPLKLIWTLQISKSQKWGLAGLLSAGFFATVCGFIRFIYVIRTRRAGNGTGSGTYEAYYLAIFTILELHVGVICASVTALKPLFSKAVPAVISSLRSSGNKIHGGVSGTRDRDRTAQGDLESQKPISIKVQQTILITNTEIGMDDLALGGSSTFSRESEEALKYHY